MTTTSSIPADGEPGGNVHISRVMVMGRESEFCAALESGLAKRNCVMDIAADNADAMCRLRRAPADVIITNPSTAVEDDLALLEKMRAIRPEVKVIVLAPSFTPEDVIAALQARVFICKSAPFDANEITAHAAQAATEADALQGIEITSARRDWLSLRVSCQMLVAERLVSFLKELQSDLPVSPREELMSHSTKF